MSGMWGRPAAAVDVFTKGKQGRRAPQEVPAKVRWRGLSWGDSAERLLERFSGPAEPLSAPSIWVAQEGKTTPPPTRRAAFTSALCLLFYTVFTFYSFSSFLPFDGLLCVQTVGKFSVMMRSSSTGNSPHRYRHSDAHPHSGNLRCPPVTSPPVSLTHFQNLCRDPTGPWLGLEICCLDLSRNREEMLSRK